MTNQKSKLTRQRSAFTLLEILVVVGIIAALATIAVVYLLPQSEKAKKEMAKAEIKAIENAVKLYYKDHEEFPVSLELLYQQDEHGGPYLREEDAVVTPWKVQGQKQYYTYQPDAAFDNGGIPLIYVEAPDGTVISNQAQKEIGIP